MGRITNPEKLRFRRPRLTDNMGSGAKTRVSLTMGRLAQSSGRGLMRVQDPELFESLRHARNHYLPAEAPVQGGMRAVFFASFEF